MLTVQQSSSNDCARLHKTLKYVLIQVVILLQFCFFVFHNEKIYWNTAIYFTFFNLKDTFMMVAQTNVSALQEIFIWHFKSWRTKNYRLKRLPHKLGIRALSVGRIWILLKICLFYRNLWTSLPPNFPGIAGCLNL